MNTHITASCYTSLRRAAFLIVVLAAISAPDGVRANEPRGGDLVSIRELTDQLERQAAQTERISNSENFQEGSRRASGLDDKIHEGNLDEAAEQYVRDLESGYGPAYHRKRKELAEEQIRESRRLIGELQRTASVSGDSQQERDSNAHGTEPIHELHERLKDVLGNPDDAKLVEEVDNYLKDSLEADEAFLKDYPEAGLHFLDEVGDVSPELIEHVLRGGARDLIFWTEARNRAARAEAFYKSVPTILRIRARNQEESGEGTAVRDEQPAKRF